VGPSAARDGPSPARARWATWVVGAGDRARGQGIVEYGLILSLSTCLAAVLLFFFGGTLSAVLQAVGDAIDAAS
jgi:Flp pilus assembly pilin Flp